MKCSQEPFYIKYLLLILPSVNSQNPLSLLPRDDVCEYKLNSSYSEARGGWNHWVQV